MSGTLPFDINSLAGGAVRVMYAPITAPVPDGLDDLFVQTTPYTAATPWLDVGATSGPFDYDRNLTVGEYKIEQQSSAVLSEVTDLVRTITVPIAEMRSEIWQLMENAPAINTVVAGTGFGPSKQVPFGSVVDLTSYRMAFIGQRKLSQGASTIEATRGRFVAGLLYHCELDAGSSKVTFGRGNLASGSLVMRLYPEPGQPQGQEYGMWVDEDGA